MDIHWWDSRLHPCPTRSEKSLTGSSYESCSLSIVEHSFPKGVKSQVLPLIGVVYRTDPGRIVEVLGLYMPYCRKIRNLQVFGKRHLRNTHPAQFIAIFQWSKFHTPQTSNRDYYRLLTMPQMHRSGQTVTPSANNDPGDIVSGLASGPSGDYGPSDSNEGMICSFTPLLVTSW